MPKRKRLFTDPVSETRSHDTGAVVGWGKDDAMPKDHKLVARPVSKILAIDTDEVVGWLYRWNTGDLQIAWLKGEPTRPSYQAIAPEDGHERAEGPLELAS